jgi:peptidoglycan/LPS O-acetylase OafA/YrhL
MARGWSPRIPLGFAWVLATVGVAAAMFVPYSLSRYAVTLIPFAVLVVSLAAADLRGARVFTSSPWMVKLGDWSYCFYLIHLVVIMVTVSAATRIELPMWATIAVALSGSVVAAWLLHTKVEKPAEKMLRP